MRGPKAPSFLSSIKLLFSLINSSIIFSSSSCEIIVNPRLSTASHAVAPSCFDSQLMMSGIASLAVFPASRIRNSSLNCSSLTLSTSIPARLNAFMVSVNATAMTVVETLVSSASTSNKSVYSESRICLTSFRFKPYSFVKRFIFWSGNSGRSARSFTTYFSLN